MAKAAEIELKAHVGNSNTCKKTLDVLAGEGTAFSKDDSYWFAPAVLHYFSGPRVRQETKEKSTKTLVTWKNKQKRGELEVNDEHELEVSNGKEFEKLLVLLGLEKQTVKHKQGWSWHYNEITIELCEVSGSVKKSFKKNSPAKQGRVKNLGWFLELEIIADDTSDTTIVLARDRLLAVLEQAGVGNENIESRYYTEMLAE
ncbi:MAG: CYTH domain-containing protein [Treponema sp.]|nr:CYTH domain-containing protein [Treponema sp.]